MRHGDHPRQSMLHENNLPWEPMLLARDPNEGQTSWYEISKLSNVNITGFTLLT